VPSRRRRFTRSPGRRTTWASVDTGMILAAADDYTTIDLLSNFKADGGVQQAVTVVRTHLMVAVTSAVQTGDRFSLGLIRGQSTDVGDNIAGAPVADADPYEDWLLWKIYNAGTTDSGSGAGVFSPHGNTNVLEFDLKAQRKLEELQMSYNLVIRNIASEVAFTPKITGRILLMLP